jgi:hypothetical protein
MSAKKTEHNLTTISDVISHYNLLIFDEQNWKKKGLWKIAEVTYSYDKLSGVNETLFVKI